MGISIEIDIMRFLQPFKQVQLKPVVGSRTIDVSRLHLKRVRTHCNRWPVTSSEPVLFPTGQWHVSVCALCARACVRVCMCT